MTLEMNSNKPFRLLLLVILYIMQYSHIVLAESSNQETETIPLIIDSDGAPDDVYAILYLLKHPRISVRALTLSCGVGYVNESAQNFVKLMSYLGYNDIPVAAGKETPLYVNHAFPTPWREGSYNFFGLDLPPSENQVSDMNASELIISLVHSSSEKITIVALGPLTNVALAIHQVPSIFIRLK